MQQHFTMSNDSNDQRIVEVNLPKNKVQTVAYNDDETSHNVHDIEARNSIRLPVLAHGYRTVPCGWDELVDIVLHQKDLAKLSRSEEQQYNYELYKQNILLQWDTMTDYVLYTKFPNVFTKVDGTLIDSPPQRRWKVHPPIESISTKQMALVKNDFPYYMDDNIEHWILWKLGGEAINDVDIENAKQDLCTYHNLRENDFIHWVNPVHLKSIPNIEHAHILGRVK